MEFKEDHQHTEDVVSVNQNQEQQTSQNAYVEDQSQQGLDEAAWAEKIQGNEQEHTHHTETEEESHDHTRERLDHNNPERKNFAARLQGDNDLQGIFNGTETIKEGDTGLNVTKLQQALVDMNYTSPVDATFGAQTLAALEKFQAEAGLNVSGEFDSETIQAMDARFDERTDYITAADNFETNAPREGTRTLDEEDKSAALEALTPEFSTPGATFDEQDAAAYSNAIKDHLDGLISDLHKELYAELAPLRANPEENFHTDHDIEGAANAGKDVTDQLYGNLNTASPFVMNVNLLDQWADQEARIALLNDSEKQRQARSLVEYLIDANCIDINAHYNATPSATEEAKALQPVIDSFVDSEEKVQLLLDIDKGWKGVQQGGIQYLQRYKDPNNEINRKRMWELFHVSIHEYLHTLAHSEYLHWAYSLGGSESHTLVEGFCDFFTLNVRAKFPTSALTEFQQEVEGSFYDAETPQAIPEVGDLNVGVYSSNKEAEKMVGIIGINNAQLGYFKGAIDLMGQ